MTVVSSECWWTGSVTSSVWSYALHTLNTHDIKSHCRSTFYPILSSTCYVERFNKITSNLTKDNLLGRSALNLSSCCSAIGPLPFSKVNMNSQNVSLSLLHLSLLEHGATMKWLASKFGNEDINSRDQQSYQLLHWSKNGTIVDKGLYRHMLKHAVTMDEKESWRAVLHNNYVQLQPWHEFNQCFHSK